MSSRYFRPNLNSRTSNATALPVELLVIIFNFVGPSTLWNPYPYLRLSWVCSYWRFAIHNDPRFGIDPYMNGLINAQGAVCYPNSRVVDLIVHSNRGDTPVLQYWNTLQDLKEAFSSKSYREQIRTLLFPMLEFTIDIKSDLIFPKLKRLALTHPSHSASGDQPSATELTSQLIKMTGLIAASPNLRSVELPWQLLSHFYSQSLTHHPDRIERLKLESVTLPSNFRRILENMPNLQVLILSMTSSSPIQCITCNSDLYLPKLRILSLDSLNGEIWKMRAPNLDHLSVLNVANSQHDRHYPELVGSLIFIRTVKFSDWDVLKSFNFSKISSILVGVHPNMPEEENIDRCNMWGHPSVVCISASNHTLLDCLPFQHFHRDGLNSRPLLDDYLDFDLPPKHCFHIPIQRPKHLGCFNYILSRVTNLVELTLHYGGIKSHTDPDYYAFLKSILDSAACEKITSLNIIHGRSFTAACALLRGQRVPRLERLMYHNTFMVKKTVFIPDRLRILQNNRLESSSHTLKIPELRNFSNVPPKRAQEIEELGVQLIQI